jgi:hypothetical protein
MGMKDAALFATGGCIVLHGVLLFYIWLISEIKKRGMFASRKVGPPLKMKAMCAMRTPLVFWPNFQLKKILVLRLDSGCGTGPTISRKGMERVLSGNLWNVCDTLFRLLLPWGS